MDDVRKTIDELKNDNLELVVISYSSRESDRFEKMFSKNTPIFHATTPRAMTQSLTQVIEKIVF
jgi:hypothetical protein